MSSKEKYIEFIVNDLVDKTKIDYFEGDIYIYPPFWSMPQGCPFSAIYSFSFFNQLFPEYVIARYGVNKDEVKIIWDIYSERIQNKVE